MWLGNEAPYFLEPLFGPVYDEVRKIAIDSLLEDKILKHESRYWQTVSSDNERN